MRTQVVTALIVVASLTACNAPLESDTSKTSSEVSKVSSSASAVTHACKGLPIVGQYRKTSFNSNGETDFITVDEDCIVKDTYCGFEFSIEKKADNTPIDSTYGAWQGFTVTKYGQPNGFCMQSTGTCQLVYITSLNPKALYLNCNNWPYWNTNIAYSRMN